MSESRGRFVARQADPSINVSDTHPLAEAGVLFAGLGAVFIAVVIISVFLVDILVGLVSIEREAKWFGSLRYDEIGELMDGARITTDHAEHQKTAALLETLSEYWPERAYQFRLLIAESSVPNAVALPGGTIVVTSRLLDDVESENELAFVLAHELGHFHGRDHLRRLGRITLISLIYNATIGSGGFASNLSDLSLRGFDRQQERDADRFGLELCAAHYGHIAGTGDFFRRLDQGPRSLLNRYVDTHPGTTERLDDMTAFAREQGWPENGTLTPWSEPSTVDEQP
ncbi:MAG: M48 family metallopeptidase [Pseudomonadota bacterium]